MTFEETTAYEITRERLQKEISNGNAHYDWSQENFTTIYGIVRKKGKSK